MIILFNIIYIVYYIYYKDFSIMKHTQMLQNFFAIIPH